MLVRLYGNINYTGTYQDLQTQGKYSRADGSLQFSPRSLQTISGITLSAYYNGSATHSIYKGNVPDVGASLYDKIDSVIVEGTAQAGTTYVQPPTSGSSSSPAMLVPPAGYSYTPQYAGQAPAGYDTYRRPLYLISQGVPLWDRPRRRPKPQQNNDPFGGDFLTTLLTVKLLGGL